jgi:hypothetical protein
MLEFSPKLGGGPDFQTSSGSQLWASPQGVPQLSEFKIKISSDSCATKKELIYPSVGENYTLVSNFNQIGHESRLHGEFVSKIL